MTDRELLELAAKASGVDASWHSDDADYLAKHEGMWLNGNRSPDNSAHWNPLTNDGDAFRLAVNMRFEIDVYYGEVASGEEGERRQTLIGDDADRCAATRRAIVRAAAEIGRAMDGA
jgi:hypothetical protein